MSKKTAFRLVGVGSPRINTFWFDGLGLSNRRIKEGAASWRALDIIYNHGFGVKNGFSALIDDFWIGMMNAQAVRNRLKIVKREIMEAVLRFKDRREVRLLSLACGSAQAVIEAIVELKAAGVVVRVILVDIDQSALDHTKDLARRHNVGDQIETIRGSVAQIGRVSRRFRPQVIEMVGFLDYIPHEKAVKLVSKIRASLEPGGIFITSNIVSNPEKFFLRWVINWPMIYRTPQELLSVLTEGGFRNDNYRIVQDPLKIHTLAVCQKID